MEDGVDDVCELQSGLSLGPHYQVLCEWEQEVLFCVMNRY